MNFVHRCSQDLRSEHDRSGKPVVADTSKRRDSHRTPRYKCKSSLSMTVNRPERVASIVVSHRGWHALYQRMPLSQRYYKLVEERMRGQPNLRAHELFKEWRAEALKIVAEVPAPAIAPPIAPLDALYPSQAQCRWLLADARARSINSLLCDLAGAPTEGEFAQAHNVLAAFERDGVMRKLDLGDHDEYDYLAFTVPAFEPELRDAIEVALDGTRASSACGASR
jgi:hypothetical protein